MISRRMLLTAGIVLTLSGCVSPPAPAPTATGGSFIDREVACLHEAGFDAVVTWNGGVQSPVDLPPAQFQLYLQADRDCSTAVGNDNLTLSEAQLSQLYDQELVERSCLIEQGYGVDDPPSRQTFIDTWDTGVRWAAWDVSDAFDPNGFDSDSARSQQLQRDLALVCPPPSWFLALDGLG